MRAKQLAFIDPSAAHLFERFRVGDGDGVEGFAKAREGWGWDVETTGLRQVIVKRAYSFAIAIQRFKQDALKIGGELNVHGGRQRRFRDAAIVAPCLQCAR